MGCILKYYRNQDLFLICVISSKGRCKMLKCKAFAYFVGTLLSGSMSGSSA
jgi:hypothetical protein